MSFYSTKSLLVTIGSLGVLGIITWLLLLPVKLIFKDKFSMRSAMAGVGTMCGFSVVMAGFCKNKAQIEAFDQMVENM